MRLYTGLQLAWVLLHLVSPINWKVRIRFNIIAINLRTFVRLAYCADVVAVIRTDQSPSPRRVRPHSLPEDVWADGRGNVRRGGAAENNNCYN